jgi:hypothetical protein
MELNHVILTLSSQSYLFVSDLVSELDTSMDEVFRFNSGYCPSIATAPTTPMASLLDTKNQSYMMIHQNVI